MAKGQQGTTEGPCDRDYPVSRLRVRTEAPGSTNTAQAISAQPLTSTLQSTAQHPVLPVVPCSCDPSWCSPKAPRTHPGQLRTPSTKESVGTHLASGVQLQVSSAVPVRPGPRGDMQGSEHQGQRADNAVLLNTLALLAQCSHHAGQPQRDCFTRVLHKHVSNWLGQSVLSTHGKMDIKQAQPHACYYLLLIIKKTAQHEVRCVGRLPETCRVCGMSFQRV